MSKPVDEVEVQVGRMHSAEVAAVAEGVKEERGRIEVEVVEVVVETGRRIDPGTEELCELGRVGR